MLHITFYRLICWPKHLLTAQHLAFLYWWIDWALAHAWYPNNICIYTEDDVSQWALQEWGQFTHSRVTQILQGLLTLFTMLIIFGRIVDDIDSGSMSGRCLGLLAEPFLAEPPNLAPWVSATSQLLTALTCFSDFFPNNMCCNTSSYWVNFSNWIDWSSSYLDNCYIVWLWAAMSASF